MNAADHCGRRCWCIWSTTCWLLGWPLWGWLSWSSGADEGRAPGGHGAASGPYRATAPSARHGIRSSACRVAPDLALPASSAILTIGYPIGVYDRQETTMSVRIASERCPQNHRCPAVRVCPVGALSQDGHSAPRVDARLCTDCGRCQRTCPTGALQS
ncbi:MAG: DUF362 domain-containing protein [Anaerolineae bacterium]